MGRMTGIAILSLLALPKAKTEFHYFFRILIGIVAFIYLFLCGSRGPALFVPLAASGYLLLHYGIRSGKTVMGIIAIGLCIIGILQWVPSPAIKRLQDNPFEERASGYERLILYEKAISDWSDNKLAGLGTGGFGLGYRSDHGYPHNIFLELGVENGAVGVGIFVVWLLVIFKKYFRLKRHIVKDDDLKSVDWAFCIFAYGLMNAQVSGSLMTNDWVWYGGIFALRAINMAMEESSYPEMKSSEIMPTHQTHLIRNNELFNQQVLS